MKNLKNERLNEIRTNIRGERMQIVEYKNTHNIVVMFDNGTKVKTRYYEFKRGKVFCHRKKCTNCEIIEEEPGNGLAVDIAMALGSFVLISLFALGFYALLGGEL